LNDTSNGGRNSGAAQLAGGVGSAPSPWCLLPLSVSRLSHGGRSWPAMRERESSLSGGKRLRRASLRHPTTRNPEPPYALRPLGRWSHGHRQSGARGWRHARRRASGLLRAPVGRARHTRCRHGNRHRFHRRLPRIPPRYPMSRPGCESQTRHADPTQRYHRRHLRLRQPPRRPAFPLPHSSSKRPPTDRIRSRP
jgi:hypothetical protein